MFTTEKCDTITKILINNIEIIEFENRFTSEFKDNILKTEKLIMDTHILKEEITLILKLKFLIELSNENSQSLDIIKKILINLVEINEFKKMVHDGYGLGKGGYWSFRKEFRVKEIEINNLESEFYRKHAKHENTNKLDEIALKFKKSLDKTHRSGWL